MYVRRYVEPLVDNVTQLCTHRKFQAGDNNSVNTAIRMQLAQQHANSGAYCVAIDAARPGTAYIAFGAGGPESNLYREWFNITPKGEQRCESVPCVCGVRKALTLMSYCMVHGWPYVQRMCLFSRLSIQAIQCTLILTHSTCAH